MFFFFIFQSYVWKELLLAAIGEQFIDFLPEDDDICGLSVSPREKDDLIQIWNINSKAVQQSRVLEKVHSLVPDVRFNAEFYKRKSKKYSEFLKELEIYLQFLIKSDKILNLANFDRQKLGLW